MRLPIGVIGCLLITALPFLGGCSPHRPQTSQNGTGGTLAAVKSHGYVSCGASQGTIGFSAPNSQGYWLGLDVDVCRAVAAAVFGDKNKARFLPLTGAQRLTALQTGQIDLIARTLTWTLSRDANGVNFTLPNFYDYVGFLVRKDHHAAKALDLKNASICVQTGSTIEVTLADVSRRQNLGLRPVIFDSVQGSRQAFFSGRCDALITDASALASVRATSKNANDYVIFPADNEIEALTPAVRHGDDQWFDIVKFSIAALIDAEQLGITRKNVDDMLKSSDPDVRRFLGVEKGNGEALGLPEDWAYQIIKQVGNYGEIYDRNVGDGSALKIPRGLNRLQRDGGLMVPIPFN